MILRTEGNSNKVVCSFSEGEEVGNLIVSLEQLLDYADIGTGFYRVVVERFVEERSCISRILKSLPIVDINLNPRITGVTVFKSAYHKLEDITSIFKFGDKSSLAITLFNFFYVLPITDKGKCVESFSTYGKGDRNFRIDHTSYTFPVEKWTNLHVLVIEVFEFGVLKESFIFEGNSDDIERIYKGTANTDRLLALGRWFDANMKIVLEKIDNVVGESDGSK